MTLRKCVHRSWMSPLQQTGSSHMMDPKRGDTVKLNLMLQTKYQIKPTYTSLEIFDKNFKNSINILANRSSQMLDLKEEKTVKLTLIMPQTKYQINPIT